MVLHVWQSVVAELDFVDLGVGSMFLANLHSAELGLLFWVVFG